MNRTVEVKSHLNCGPGVQVVIVDPLEVSLDCHVCGRIHRTVLLNSSKGTTMWLPKNDVKITSDEIPAICTPTLHIFPAHVLNRQIGTVASSSIISFHIGYTFQPFTDKEYNQTAIDIPSWARIHFTLICPRCGRASGASTQTDAVRPSIKSCVCGYELYIDNQPPEFENLRRIEEGT